MKKYEWVDTITLPERNLDDMGDGGCYNCDGIMKPCLITSEFEVKGRTVKIHNVRAWKCVDCGEIIYDSNEAKLIEEVLENETLESV